MGTALAITRTDHTASELRAVACKSTDGEQIRRILALALEGRPRTEAAEQTGMDWQTLRDWVHRYNDGGVEGLKSRRSPGPAPALTEEQMAELKALVVRGPDPAVDNVVRWRCVDLRQKLADRFNVDVHESTIGKWLRQFGMTRLQPRPFHPKKDAAAGATFKKRNSPGLSLGSDHP
jgi:transposase